MILLEIVEKRENIFKLSLFIKVTKEVSMSKKCLYCSIEVPDSSVIDFCERCGVGHFGRKMFDAIVTNMEEAREKGDLCNHRVETVRE